LSDLLVSVRTGRSAVLVLAGEPGIGKTALLDHAAGEAEGLTVLRASGVESERELAFAALHRLCLPVLDRLEDLPDAHGAALGVAFGRVRGEAPDRLLVCAAVLGLLSEAARGTPLVCIVDDCQWLDRASAEVLDFLARRLGRESVLLLLATRDCDTGWRHLPALRMEGLCEDAARRLLDSVIQGPLDESVRDRIVAESRGNPLAVLQLPRGLPPVRLAGGFGVLATAPALSERIAESFHARGLALPVDSRRLLLIAAAEPLGSPTLLWRAAELPGVGRHALEAVEKTGLLRVEQTHVVLRHPLVRSAVYRAATVGERSAVHRALAEASDPGTDPDRRAWHRAGAAPAPDDEVADDLERSAERAGGRGGAAAAAAFLVRSAELTRDPVLRAGRQLAAAESTLGAGGFDAALDLANAAAAGPLQKPQQARLQLLRGRIAFTRRFGNDAPPLLLEAAQQLEALDAGHAREVYLEVLSSTLLAGRLGDSRTLTEVARAASSAGSSRPCDLLLNGLCTLILQGYDLGVPALRTALDALRRADPRDEDVLRWHWLAGHAAGLLWDFESWEFLSGRLLEVCRATGALSTLPVALNTRGGACLISGRFAEAESLAAEARALQQATGGTATPYAALGLAAVRGRETEARSLIAATLPDAEGRGEGTALMFIQWASAVLYNGLGRYDAACEAATAASGDAHVRRFGNWALVELIEAAVRSGRSAAAHEAFDRLKHMTGTSGSDWALGIEARTGALLCDGDEAEDRYREAIDRLSRTPLRPDLARARLLYGEWLRMGRRRGDAREQLRCALASFEELGMEAFAERAGVELSAAGGAVRRGREATAPLGGGGLAHGGTGSFESGDCDAPVHQRQDGRIPPAQCLPETRRRLPDPADRAAVARGLFGAGGHGSSASAGRPAPRIRVDAAEGRHWGKRGYCEQGEGHQDLKCCRARHSGTRHGAVRKGGDNVVFSCRRRRQRTERRPGPRHDRGHRRRPARRGAGRRETDRRGRSDRRRHHPPRPHRTAPPAPDAARHTRRPHPRGRRRAHRGQPDHGRHADLDERRLRSRSDGTPIRPGGRRPAQATPPARRQLRFRERRPPLEHRHRTRPRGCPRRPRRPPRRPRRRIHVAPSTAALDPPRDPRTERPDRRGPRSPRDRRPAPARRRPLHQRDIATPQLFRTHRPEHRPRRAQPSQAPQPGPRRLLRAAQRSPVSPTGHRTGRAAGRAAVALRPCSGSPAAGAGMHAGISTL
jgi:tetratricopeptide (TPR) repeat protein